MWQLNTTGIISSLSISSRYPSTGRVLCLYSEMRSNVTASSSPAAEHFDLMYTSSQSSRRANVRPPIYIHSVIILMHSLIMMMMTMTILNKIQLSLHKVYQLLGHVTMLELRATYSSAMKCRIRRIGPTKFDTWITMSSIKLPFRTEKMTVKW